MRYVARLYRDHIATALLLAAVAALWALLSGMTKEWATVVVILTLAAGPWAMAGLVMWRSTWAMPLTVEACGNIQARLWNETKGEILITVFDLYLKNRARSKAPSAKMSLHFELELELDGHIVRIGDLPYDRLRKTANSPISHMMPNPVEIEGTDHLRLDLGFVTEQPSFADYATPQTLDAATLRIRHRRWTLPLPIPSSYKSERDSQPC